MSLLKSAGALIGLVLCLAFAPMAQAGQADPFRNSPMAQGSAPLWLAGVSIETAIQKAKGKYGGKVLSAKEIRSKGPLVYKIKLLLPNGRVKTVFVDGESGEVFEA
ncbi:MAG: PepSY domain-containing protein [Ketobacteraceae bacterium]|nr:PepSY domain-containing protein [Ketobacteraceae bacterium]